MHEIRNFLEPLLDLREDQWKIISEVFRPKKLSKGEMSAKAGVVCRELAFVKKGMLRHYYLVDGNEVTRWIAFENSFTTSSISFFRQVPSVENIVAVKPSELLVVQNNQWQALLQRVPEMYKALALIMQENYIGMEERLHDMIALSAEERYAKWMGQYPHYAEKVPLQHIASLLGISPQHLSRIRGKKK